MTLFQNTGAKKGRGLGTKTVSRGVPVPSAPRPAPHSLQGPWEVTSGLSHLRGHDQGSLRAQSASSGSPPPPKAFRSHREPLFLLGRPRPFPSQLPAGASLGLSSQQPGEGAMQPSLPGSSC